VRKVIWLLLTLVSFILLATATQAAGGIKDITGYQVYTLNKPVSQVDWTGFDGPMTDVSFGDGWLKGGTGNYGKEFQFKLGDTGTLRCIIVIMTIDDKIASVNIKVQDLNQFASLEDLVTVVQILRATLLDRYDKSIVTSDEFAYTGKEPYGGLFLQDAEGDLVVLNWNGYKYLEVQYMNDQYRKLLFAQLKKGEAKAGAVDLGDL
jgi:hypothetical protein